MNLTSISLAAALAFTAAGASFAQPASPPPGGHAEDHHSQRPDPAQMAERHAKQLRDTLQLRPDQEPALRAFIAATAHQPGEMAGMRHEHGDDAGLTTPQRLDRMAARMAEHQARFREHAEALKRFYAQLSPTQQKAFDAMPMHRGMGPPGPRGHEAGHEGGHMPHGPQGGPGGHDHGPPPAGE